MKSALILLSLPLIALAGGCTTAESGGTAAQAPAAPMAKASLLGGDGSAKGEATVTEAADGLHVAVKGMGLTPGMHAVHIHMTGTCTGPDFTSAGGHWNPAKHQHGKDNPQGMHMGDMPNMQVGSDGTGQMDYVVPAGMLKTGETPLLDTDGAAIVIHAAPDDYKTDPTGNAGGRVACGVVTAG